MNRAAGLLALVVAALLACRSGIRERATGDETACFEQHPQNLQQAWDSCARAIQTFGLRHEDTAALRARIGVLQEMRIQEANAERGPAATTAAVLYQFLLDGEDGCTCGGDLQKLVRAFQTAHDTDPLARGSRPGSLRRLLPKHGYFEASTSRALALYTSQRLVPCYGSRSRCGPVPGDPDEASLAAREIAATVAHGAQEAGACVAANLDRPGGETSCVETIVLDRMASPARLKGIEDGLREACAKRDFPEGIIRVWRYVGEGCPEDDRIAACRFADGSDRRVAHVEWSYVDAGTEQELRKRCSEHDGAFVMFPDGS